MTAAPTLSASISWTPSAQVTAQFARLSVSEPWFQRLLYMFAYGRKPEKRWANRLRSFLDGAFTGILRQAYSQPYVLTEQDKLHIARRLFSESYGERNPLMYRLPEVDAFGKVLFAELIEWVSTEGNGPFFVHADGRNWSRRAGSEGKTPNGWVLNAVDGELVATPTPR